MAHSSVDKIELTFLGTMSGAPPAGGRNHTCMALRFDNFVWLFDCGDGAQLQLQKSPISGGAITRVFITHMHGDHCFGLPGMLCNIAIGSASRADREPVVVVGPMGLRSYLRMTLGSTYCRLGDFRYTVHELADVPGPSDLPPQYTAHPDQLHVNEVPGLTLFPQDGEWIIPAQASDKGVTVRACALPHTVPTLAFAMTEAVRPGRLDAARARPAVLAAGLPLSVLSALKAGNAVPLPSGGELRPEDYLAAPPTPRRVVVLGDTSDGTAAARLGRGGLLVHEATNACLAADVAGGACVEEVNTQTIEHGHSTPQMAGRAAAAMGAAHLVLTHFSPRYKGDGAPASVAVMREIADQAASVWGGPVTTARDFDVVGLSIDGSVTHTSPGVPA